MLKIVSAQEMQAIDQAASEQLKIPGIILMERAGERLAAHARELLGPLGQRVVVLAGSGKNGGDGLVAARFLFHAGVNVSVLLLLSRDMALETQANLQTLKDLGVPVDAQSEPPEAWLDRLRQTDLIVDALLGIGLSGPVRANAGRAIRMLNQSGIPILAADIPSGLNADSGEPGDPTVAAGWTLSFGLPKKGLLQTVAGPWVGRLSVDPIGFPAELIAGHPPEAMFLDQATARSLLPRRSLNVHKRATGMVLVIGGSSRYHGALLLAGMGALRAGSGFVTLAYPDKLDGIVRRHVLEELCAPMPCSPEGEWTLQALDPLMKIAAEQDAVIIGPGMGHSGETLALVKALLGKLQGPQALIVDADALRALDGPRLNANGPAVILTPHAGEAGRLLNQAPQAIEQNYAAAARELARTFQAVALLKGKNTAIASFHEDSLVISCTGTPALATAGTGDVLSGVIAALAAQKVLPSRAAALAAYLHGRAGEHAAVDPGGLGVRAREVADALPLAIRELRLFKPGT